MGKRKPPTRTALKKKADTKFSLFIRARDKKCKRCGRRPPEVRLQCAHVWSRRYLNTRWDGRNAYALCFGCHKYLTDRPIEHEDWAVSLMGADLYQELRMKAISIRPPIDYEAVIWSIEEKMKEIA